MEQKIKLTKIFFLCASKTKSQSKQEESFANYNI